MHAQRNQQHTEKGQFEMSIFSRLRDMVSRRSDDRDTNAHQPRPIEARQTGSSSAAPAIQALDATEIGEGMGLEESRELTEAGQARRDVVERAKRLKAAVFHAYTLDNTPRGFINPECGGDEWGFDDYGDLVEKAEKELREHLLANPELEQYAIFQGYYEEYRENPGAGDITETGMSESAREQVSAPGEGDDHAQRDAERSDTRGHGDDQDTLTGTPGARCHAPLGTTPALSAPSASPRSDDATAYTVTREGDVAGGWHPEVGDDTPWRPGGGPGR
jgi:hypothetical protein